MPTNKKQNTTPIEK